MYAYIKKPISNFLYSNIQNRLINYVSDKISKIVFRYDWRSDHITSIETIVLTIFLIVLTGACGKIESPRINGTNEIYDLHAGDYPHFSANINEGYLDTANETWMEFKVGSGPRMTVGINQLDCDQISGRVRVCTFGLSGAKAPEGAFVSSTWHTRFRLAGHKTATKNLTLEGTLVPHELGYKQVLIIYPTSSTTAEHAPFVDGYYQLIPNQIYAVTAFIQNNGGPVIPVITELRIDYNDPALQDRVLQHINTLGIDQGAEGNAAFSFTTPEVTTTTDGTFTISFASNEDDMNHSNDVQILPIRLVPR